MIKIKNINKTYRNGKNHFQALKDISLHLPKNCSIAITGKSGSGKSTLMHAMSGLDNIDNGEIIIDGQNIINFKPKQMDDFRNQTMGFIFQSYFVDNDETCINNVSLTLEIANRPTAFRKSKVKEVLKSVELEDKATNKARDLSGGQKQRLAIARAMANEPKILFADEPTGNLDSITSKVIEDLLFKYRQDNQATLIIVTHDLSLAKRCDMQIILKDGQISEIINNKQEIK